MLPLCREPAKNSVRSRRRCRQRLPRSESNGIYFFRCCALGAAILASSSHYHNRYTTNAYSYSSPLWRQSTPINSNDRTGQNSGRLQINQPNPFLRKQPGSSFGRGRSSAVLRMVLTTPEAIIEQASTQKLLDVLLDESTRTTSRRPIMMQFDPSSGALWRRWKGTVFSETWVSCLRNVLYSLVILYIYQSFPRMKGSLVGFNTLWGQLLSVTTFTLTFFVNQSYALWRKCYELSRRLQGRLNDIDMTLAMHAARKTPARPNEPSTYTAASRQLLDLVSRYVRLFNLLTYASFTRSHRPILTPRGMRRLVERGLMTAAEREVLMTAEIPATQRHNCVLMWITRVFIEGRQAGHFTGGSGFEQQFMEKIHVIRAQYGAIGDELQGRMPLAYAHIVQVLVDCVLMMYPLMAFTSGMAPVLGVLGTGLLTTSYQGLFDLAKQFLDPYDNENYGRGEDPLSVDTLIAESNAGSLRWMYGFEQFPVSSQRIKDGELFDYLLPVRGYSVEDLEKMEEERIQKQEELKLEREREEAERLKREEEEEVERLKWVALERTSGETEVDEKEEWVEPHPAVQEEASSEMFYENDTDSGVRDQTEISSEAKNGASNEKGNANQTVTLVDAVSAALSAASFNTTTAKAAVAATVEARSTPTESVQSKTTTVSTPQPTPTAHTVTFLADGTAISLTNEERNTQVSKDDTRLESEPSETISDNDVVELSGSGSGVPKMDDLDDGSPKETSKVVYEEPKSEDVLRTEEEEESVSIEPPASSEIVSEQTKERVNGASTRETVEDGGYIGKGDSNSEIDEKLELYKLESQPNSFVPELEDFESFRELPWFDEIGPDGQEVRLSQLLAEEEWEEEVQAAITLEEYQMLQEEAKNEMLETEEILSASPGDQGLGSKEEKVSNLPAYDQTKLDSLSQLWGLKPDVLEDLRDNTPAKEILTDDIAFNNINQLWGQPSDGPIPPQETIPLTADSFQGINQLWDEEIAPDSSGEAASRSEVGDIASRYGDEGYREANDEDEDNELDLSAYEGFDWHDDDGDRLSQILADEVWDYVEPPEQTDPISLEDYTKKVVEILEAAEDEILETEAILRAPPGADYFIEKEDDAEERVLQALNETMGEESESVDDDDLEALEMDMDYEEFLNATTSNTTVSNATAIDSFEAEEFVNFVAKQANVTRNFPEETPYKKVQPIFSDNSGDSQLEDTTAGDNQDTGEPENDDDDDPDDDEDEDDVVDDDDDLGEEEEDDDSEEPDEQAHFT